MPDAIIDAKDAFMVLTANGRKTARIHTRRKKQTKLDGGKCGENRAGQDRIAFLNGMIRKACTKVTFEQNSEEDRELARLIRRREAFQAELTANVKALRQHSTWYTKDRKEANVV